MGNLRRAWEWAESRRLSQGQPHCHLSAMCGFSPNRISQLGAPPMNTYINEDTSLGWTRVWVRVTRDPTCSPHSSRTWDQVHSRLPEALLGSPELILAPTLHWGAWAPAQGAAPSPFGPRP